MYIKQYFLSNMFAFSLNRCSLDENSTNASRDDTLSVMLVNQYHYKTSTPIVER